MVKIELPLFFNKDMNQSKTNLYCINQKHVHTQHQPNTKAHNASLFPCGFYSPRTFTPTSILPTPSFCAEPKGEVAESIIQKITLVLRKGVNRPRRWVRACQIHFSPPPNQFPPVTRCRCLSKFLHLENWSSSKGWNDNEFRWFFLHQDESWKQSPSINNLINYISTIEMFIAIYVHKWYRIQAG